MRRYLLLALGSTVVVVADQLTKIWAVGALSLSPPGGLPEDAGHILSRVQVVFDGWFNFKLAGNKGAAWGLFRSLPEGWRVPFFVVIGLVAIGVIITLYRRAHGQNLLRWALTLILGGAVGNLIDRVRLGFVVDFIDWYYGDAHWPTFNIADVAISVGVGLLVVDMIVQGRSAADAADDPVKATD